MHRNINIEYSLESQNLKFKKNGNRKVYGNVGADVITADNIELKLKFGQIKILEIDFGEVKVEGNTENN